MRSGWRAAWVCGVLVLAGLAAAQDTAVTADADTVPTLPGVTWAVPDDSADWQTVTGLANLDSLLLGGQGVVLAFEDTFSFDPGTADTVLVSAPRVTVAEVIAAIGRRMEYDNARLAEYEFTTLITQVLREQPGVNGGDYKVEEYAQRYRYDRELGEQRVKLWERTRKFKNHELVEDETKDKVAVEFMPAQESVIEAMPFSPGGAGKYNYTILDRNLVGNNLIYKIGFEPKSRFDALPTGTIWVDYSNWVLRKVESRLTGAVPYPMFLKSVPVYRLSQERFGDHWFPTEIYLRLNLRRVPLVPMPDNIEVRVSLRDLEINGMARRPQDTAPGAGVSDLSPEDLAAGFWLSAEANEDTVSAYWRQIGEDWAAEVTPAVEPVSLAPAELDSLTSLGALRLQQLRTGGLWKLQPKWLRTPGYNRSQGVVARAGLDWERQGPNRPRLGLTAGYAFANHRPVFSGQLDVPLVRARWMLAKETADGHKYRGAQYQLLSLHLAGRKDGALFAGDNRRHTRSVSAGLYGSDPNHYYEERGFDGRLNLRLSRGLSVRGGGGFAAHRPWGQETDWNLLGRQLRPDGNLTAAALDDRFWTAGASWQRGAASLEADVIWHEPGTAGSGGGETTRREWRVHGELDLLDNLGNTWLLRGTHRAFDGPAPVQWKTWLGDYGTLRGYGAGELTGDNGAYASLDARLGFDLWRTLRVPLLRDWGLQPIGFVDWGKTWDATGGVTGPGEGARDWRMDVGFGFGKRFDVPGLGEFRNVRVYAARPVGEGSDGEGWRVLVGFEK